MIHYHVRLDGPWQREAVDIWQDGVLIGTLSEGIEPISTLHLVTKYDAVATVAPSELTERTTIAISIRIRQ